MTLAIKQN